MPEAIIRFEKCIQDSQDYGSDDDHMVSRIFFSIEVEGHVHDGLSADVKQPVGDSFDDAPLEVTRPSGYDGSLDYAPFREAVEAYYRGLFGLSGSKGGQIIRMRHNICVKQWVVHIEYTGDSPAW